MSIDEDYASRHTSRLRKLQGKRKHARPVRSREEVAQQESKWGENNRWCKFRDCHAPYAIRSPVGYCHNHERLRIQGRLEDDEPVRGLCNAPKAQKRRRGVGVIRRCRTRITNRPCPAHPWYTHDWDADPECSEGV